MRFMPRVGCALLGVGWGVAALAGGPSSTAPETGNVVPALSYSAPYLPQPGDVLQEVPSAKDPAVVAMRSLRSAVDAAPTSWPAASRLADSYVDYSRQIGDAHYAGYAEAVITPWLSQPSPPAGALLIEATILQYRHEFPPALTLLQRTLSIDPHNGQAWLTLATLNMVQGDYSAAGKGCAQVANVAGLQLGLACLGSLRSYTGQARQSLSLLRQADPGAAAPPATQAWIHGLLAESAERLGDWTQAEAEYRAALHWLPQDNFLLVAYADFLLDRSRPQEVLPLLADHTQSDTAFLRIALAHSALRSPTAFRYTWMMAARFEALALRGSDYFGREEARFALQLQHDPKTSLEMASKNWQIQRAPWDARVLLEAALAARQPEAAREVVTFVTATKLEDPVVVPLARQVSEQLAALHGPHP